MTQFNPEGPQKFDKDSFTVLLKNDEGKIFLSREMAELYSLIGNEADKILEGVLNHNSSYYEKVDFITEDKANSDYFFVSSNIYPFILENKRIILKIS